MFFQACNSGSVYSGSNDLNLAHLNTLSTIVPQPSLLCLAPIKNQAVFPSTNKHKVASNFKPSIPNAKKYQPVLNNLKSDKNLTNFENHIKYDQHKQIQNSLYILKSQNTLQTNNKMGVKLFLPDHKNERSLLTQPIINKAFNISNMPMTQKTANIMSYLKPVILTKPMTKLDQSNQPIFVTYIPSSLSSNNSSPIILSYLSKPQTTHVKNSIIKNQKNSSPKCSVVTLNENKRISKTIPKPSKANLLKNSLLFADHESLDDTDEELYIQEINTIITNGNENYNKSSLNRNYAGKYRLKQNNIKFLSLLEKLKHDPQNIINENVDKLSSISDNKDMPPKVSLDLLCKNYNNECQKKPCIFTSFSHQNCAEKKIQYCSRYALPYSNLCSIHIAAHPLQKLFERCSAKFSNNVQCIKPAFDPINEVPLCWQHSRKKAHHDQTLEKNYRLSSVTSFGTSKRPSKMSQTLLVLEKGETVLRDLHALPLHYLPTDKGISSNAKNISPHSLLSNSHIETIMDNSNQNSIQQQNKNYMFCNDSNVVDSCITNNLSSQQNVSIDLINPPNDKSVGVGKATKRERKRRPAAPKKTLASMLASNNNSKRGKLSSGYSNPEPKLLANAMLALNHLSSNITNPSFEYNTQAKLRTSYHNILTNPVGVPDMNYRFKPPPSMFGLNDPFLSGTNNCFNQAYPRRNGCYTNGPYNSNGPTINSNQKRPSLTMSPLSNVTGDNSHNSNDLLFNFSTDLLDKSFDTDTLNAATNMIIEDVDMKDLNKLSEETFNDIFQDMGKEGNLSLNHMEDSSSCHDSALPTKEDEILMNQALSDINKDIATPGPVGVDFENEIIRLIQVNLMKDYQPPPAHQQTSFCPTSAPATLPSSSSLNGAHNFLLAPNAAQTSFLQSSTTTINSSSQQSYKYLHHYPNPSSSDYNHQSYYTNQHRYTSRSASLPCVYPLELITPNFLVNGLDISPVSAAGGMVKGKEISSLPSVAHLLGLSPLHPTPHNNIPH